MSRETGPSPKMVQRLIALFRWERAVYLSLAGVAALMLLVVLVLLLRESAGAASFTLLLGAVGLLIVILGRLLRMWDQVDDLVTAVSREQAGKE